MAKWYCLRLLRALRASLFIFERAPFVHMVPNHLLCQGGEVHAALLTCPFCAYLGRNANHNSFPPLLRPKGTKLLTVVAGVPRKSLTDCICWDLAF